ncbi:MAG: putative zinc-binding metallopeptidase [Bdellovibrionales bacterium]|nr:putative zinc-binding metallopeptidase [Bdellovibrionales bacterium]
MKKISNIKHLNYVEKLERQILLNLPLNRLPLKRHNELVSQAIAQLLRELKTKKIPFSPAIWVSTEWFCPDNVCGIAIPFYLFHPTLLKMEKEKIGFVEGETYPQLLKLLRHETGHAFENYYGTRSHPLRQKVFGKSNKKPYPSSYKPQLYSTNYIHHLGDGYAQSHPDEDFAETFATWLAFPKKNWQEKYKYKSKILTKLLAIENLVKEHKDMTPLKKCSFKPYEPIEKDKRFLKEYFLQKSRKYKFSVSNESKKMLLSTTPVSEKKRKNKLLDLYIKKHRPIILQKLAQTIGIHKYQISKIIKPLENELAKVADANLNSENEIVNYLLDLTTVEILEGLHKKRDRIYL